MNKLPTLAPQNMTEAMDFSKMLASSQMVPKQYQRKPQDILVAVQWGYELGLQPLQALQNIAIINGKPSVYGDAALALVKNDHRCAGVHEIIEGEGDNRAAVCTVKRRYGEEIEETVGRFTVADAKRARLWNKQGPWSQYPDRMLQMRARGFAIRDAFPDALKGVITAEEAQDYPTEARNDVPAVNPLDQIQAPPETQEKEVEVVEEIVEAAEEVVEESVNKSPWIVKNHEGKIYGSIIPKDPDDFVKQYINLMQIYSAARQNKEGDVILPREKMTMLREVKEANTEVIDMLDQKDQAKIDEIYKGYLRRLGASIKKKEKEYNEKLKKELAND